MVVFGAGSWPRSSEVCHWLLHAKFSRFNKRWSLAARTSGRYRTPFEFLVLGSCAYIWRRTRTARTSCTVWSDQGQSFLLTTVHSHRDGPFGNITSHSHHLFLRYGIPYDIPVIASRFERVDGQFAPLRDQSVYRRYARVRMSSVHTRWRTIFCRMVRDCAIQLILYC